jgi:hypothetical protein
MLVSGQWTPQKNRFEITQERITFFNEKSKKNTSSNSGRLALFVNAKSLLQIDKQSRFENGVFLLYFNAAGIDQVLILMARRKLFSMISLKHTHVVVTYFECNVTFKIKVRM